MPATTRSQSESREHCLRCRSSMPGNFTSHLKPLEVSFEIIMEILLDELALETHLDLAQHPAHKLIDLSEHYVFDNASKFHYVVVADKACVLHLLAYMVRYDVTTYDKVTINYAEWEQINQDRNKLLRATAVTRSNLIRSRTMGLLMIRRLAKAR